ncbi:MAG: S-layer homology domain-containing protein [Clostridiales bacterium]|nr:S-layer homology domain-containing protein [Clostridiales bacterium]
MKKSLFPKAISLFLAIALLLGIFPGTALTRAEEPSKFLAAIGAPDSNAIKIYTAQDLDNVRKNLSGSYVLMNDIDLAGFKGGQWEPIGDVTFDYLEDEPSYDNAFTGIFDGQGYLIKNLKITGDKYSFNGLFSSISDAIVKNLGMEGTNIAISHKPAFLDDYDYSDIYFFVGTICSLSKDSSISNCYNTGNISYIINSDTVSFSVAGGICAFNPGDSPISYCYSTGNISASVTSSDYSSSYAGGICAISEAPIFNCYNTGNISASSNEDTSFAGGICGYNGVPISNCYSTGNITSTTSNGDGSFAGGICGMSYGSVSNCYSAGNITSTSSSDYGSFTGGICGGSTWGWDDDDVYISNCVVLANRISAGSKSSSSDSNSYLIGFMDDDSLKYNNLALSGISGNAKNDADRLISAAEAKNQATYTALGWDFDKVWQMVPGQDYPQLRRSSSAGISGTDDNEKDSSEKDAAEKDASEKEPWQNPFTDVKDSDWFYDNVQYVVTKGLFNGTSATTFAPQNTMTRAMLFTVLARLAEVNTDGGETWYSLALDWAVKEELTDGTGPQNPVTREQIVTILWRYAEKPTGAGKLAGFSDHSTVSDWAVEAFQWAIEVGIINGKNGKLVPQGQATRAEVAAILHRFAEIEK